MSTQNLLVYHPGALGDVITSFPLLSLLKERFETIDLVCQNSIGKLARELEIIHRSHPMEAGVFSALFSPGDNCEETRLKDALAPHDRVLLICFTRGLSQKIEKTVNKKVCRIPPRPSPEKRQHVSAHLVDKAIRAGLLSGREKFSFRTIFPDRRDPSFEPKKIILHPGSGSRMKNWPLSHFLELERMLRAEGFDPRILLGPAEDDLLEKLSGSFESAILRAENTHFSGRPFPQAVIRPENILSLPRTLKSSAAFIGNDSGVTHLAAFLGLDTLAVFGPSDPARWHPLGRSVKVVTYDPGCGPCHESEKRACDHRRCLENLAPLKVYEAFMSLKNNNKALGRV